MVVMDPSIWLLLLIIGDAACREISIYGDSDDEWERRKHAERIRINNTWVRWPKVRRDCVTGGPIPLPGKCEACPMNLFVIQDKLPDGDREILDQMAICVNLIEQYYNNPLDYKFLITVDPYNAGGLMEMDYDESREFEFQDRHAHTFGDPEQYKFRHWFQATHTQALDEVLQFTKWNNTSPDPTNPKLKPFIPAIVIMLTDGIPPDLATAVDKAKQLRQVGVPTAAFEIGH